ncbi:MAG: hypothetical protein NT029_13130 [Armatimonadetes bacterium]|nr:hypothetical protein [Armatimonadota bacterium]
MRAISAHAEAVLNDPRLIAARDRGYARLERVSGPDAVAQPFALWGAYGSSPADPMSEPERWLTEALEDLAAQAERLLDEGAFRPLCVEFGPYGVHFIDRLFGAHVRFHEGQWWSECLETPVGTLQTPGLRDDPTWRAARRVAEAFVGAGVSVPVLGLPTLSSALNVAVNLYGEAFLMAMRAGPEAARRDLTTINDLLRSIHAWYRRTVPASQLQQVVAAQRLQPPGCGQLCGCTTALLSARAYADLVAPHDAALLGDDARGGMIHLCGAHTQHLDTWSSMPQLRAVQLNDRAAADLEAYFHRLRPDQVIYLNPCDEMPLELALAITGGKRLVVVADGLGGAAPQ